MGLKVTPLLHKVHVNSQATVVSSCVLSTPQDGSFVVSSGRTTFAAHVKFTDSRIVEDQSTAETVYQQAAHGGAKGCGDRKAAAASHGTAS